MDRELYGQDSVEITKPGVTVVISGQGFLGLPQ